MNQSKLGSFIEAVANIFIGFTINFCANLIILPWFGFDIKPSQAFGIGLIFTVISIIRSYVVRRWFNSIKHAWNVRHPNDKLFPENAK